MTEPRKDKELVSNTKGNAKVETTDEDTNSSSTSEEGKKYKDAMDYFTQKTKGIVIGKPNKSETKTGKSNRKAGKRRKRAHGGIKRPISLRSGLNEIGMSFDSDSEPKNADAVAKKQQKGKGIMQEEIDVFQGSDTDSDEACKRTKKGRNYDDDDGAGGGTGTGTGAGAHTDLSSLGLQVAGK